MFVCLYVWVLSSFLSARKHDFTDKSIMTGKKNKIKFKKRTVRVKDACIPFQLFVRKPERRAVAKGTGEVRGQLIKLHVEHLHLTTRWVWVLYVRLLQEVFIRSLVHFPGQRYLFLLMFTFYWTICFWYTYLCAALTRLCFSSFLIWNFAQASSMFRFQVRWSFSSLIFQTK